MFSIETILTFVPLYYGLGTILIPAKAGSCASYPRILTIPDCPDSESIQSGPSQRRKLFEHEKKETLREEIKMKKRYHWKE